MNFDDEVMPTGRESPESTHALPVSTPAEPMGKQQQFQIRYVMNILNIHNENHYVELTGAQWVMGLHRYSLPLAPLTMEGSLSVDR